MAILKNLARKDYAYIYDLSNVRGLGSKKFSSILIDSLPKYNALVIYPKSGSFINHFYRLLIIIAVVVFQRNSHLIVFGDIPFPFHRNQTVIIQQALITLDFQHAIRLNPKSLALKILFLLLYSNKHKYIVQSYYMKSWLCSLKSANGYIDPGRVFEFYPSISSLTLDNSGSKSISANYFISVTSDLRHKHNSSLIEIWNLIIGPLTRSKLLITLRNKTSQVYEYIDFVGFLPENVVADLIGNSNGLVSMSKCESFFLPAAYCCELDVPLVAHRLPVLDELYGDSYYAFNDISQLVTSVIHSLGDFRRTPKYQKAHTSLTALSEFVGN